MLCDVTPISVAAEAQRAIIVAKLLKLIVLCKEKIFF